MTMNEHPSPSALPIVSCSYGNFMSANSAVEHDNAITLLLRDGDES
jgi:hypothetical protein